MNNVITIIINLALGALLTYGGISKFIPKPPRPETEQIEEIPPDLEKIKSFIGGLKQTGYFWQFLAITEILCGLLLISQLYALLGAVMSIPLTLNIFLFHVFLEPHDIQELILTTVYLIANLYLVFRSYPSLKKTFITIEA